MVIMQLLIHVEERFAVVIPVERVSRDNFQTARPAGDGLCEASPCVHAGNLRELPAHQ